MPTIAQDLVNSTSTRLISYTSFAPLFGSSGDAFGIFARGISDSISFALQDDSVSVFTSDTVGIIGETDSDQFFGIVDTENADNSGPVTAEWVFDISGASDLSLSIDMAAMGDFESSDSFSWEYSLDGGATFTTAFVSSVDEAASQTYTLDSGTVVMLDDPMLVGATMLNNDFQTLTTDITGSGSELILRLTAETNGGTEAIAFRNIDIQGAISGVLASAITSSGDTGLASFTNSAPTFSSSGDAFEVLQRGVSLTIPFALNDDTLSVFTPDTLGIVGENELDPFFGIVDTENGDNSGPVSAEWVFDIGNADNLALAIDMAAMGDFEANDYFVWEYSFDGGATFSAAFASFVDEEGVLDYTLDSGTLVTLADPMMVGDTVLNNDFQTLSIDLDGTGAQMVLRLTAQTNGGTEAIAFQNIEISGVAATGPSISVSDASTLEGDAGTTAMTFTLTLSEAQSEAVTVDVSTSNDTATAGSDFAAIAETITFAPGETMRTFTVDVSGDMEVEDDETFDLLLSNVVGAAIADGQGVGTILNDDIEITMIHDIQGAVGAGAYAQIGVDDISPLIGQIVTIQAVVTADFQDGAFGTLGDLNGFFVQEETADYDADPMTSEGIFIFDGFSPTFDVSYGDIVQVTGTVTERFGETQISATEVTLVDFNPSLVPDATTVTFPTASVMLDDDGGLVANLEAYEGMLVNLPQDMTITEMFNLDRFGQYTVNANGQEFQFTQTNAPDQEGYQAHLENVAANTIVLDDGLTQSNPSTISVIDGNDGVLTNTDSFRMGDTITNITGVLNYSFDEFRIQNGTGDYSQTNPRPDEPADTGGDFKVASLNVLNYFTTLDESGVVTDIAADPRGADNQAEFDRQAEKLVNAIVAMDADILGLVELENDFAGTNFAIKDLVDRVNAALGDTVYAWVDPGQEFVGGDAIANGIIYKIDEVALVGDAAILTTFEGQNFLDPLGAGRDLNRASIAQTFEDLDTGQTMTISVNHLKSKGSLSGIEADNDQLDGQGNNNATRTEAAKTLANWLASDPTGQGAENTMIIGDLNAYAMEDPLTALSALGYTDLASTALESPYSYVFDGQIGTLDYILASGPIADYLSGVTEWHINSDEPDAFDYNLDFGRDPSLFDGTTSTRNSDHDPVIAGFDLPINYNDIAGTDKHDEIFGTDGRDRIDAMGGPDIVHAGAGEDLIIVGSGPVELLFGGADADTFQFSESIATDGRKDQAFLRDFDVSEDMIDLGGAEIASYREKKDFVEIFLEGGRDRIVVENTDDFDAIIFVDPLVVV